MGSLRYRFWLAVTDVLSHGPSFNRAWLWVICRAADCVDWGFGEDPRTHEVQP